MLIILHTVFELLKERDWAEIMSRCLTAAVLNGIAVLFPVQNRVV